MKKVLQRVIFWQCFLGIVIVAMATLTPYQDAWQAVAAGALTALIATLPAWFIVRRMPAVIKGRDFFIVMVVCEAGKWLLTAIMTIIFLHYFHAFGIVIGFIVTYVGAYVGTMFMKVK